MNSVLLFSDLTEGDISHLRIDGLLPMSAQYSRERQRRSRKNYVISSLAHEIEIEINDEAYAQQENACNLRIDTKTTRGATMNAREKEMQIR